MSVKDLRYYRDCPICNDKLPGTDDGLEVFQSLESQIHEFPDEVCCALCGHCVELARARQIIIDGPPPLMNADGSESDLIL